MYPRSGVGPPPGGPAFSHCLLIESDRGLVLVDTGFGLEDVRRLEHLWSGFRSADSLRQHLRRKVFR